MNREEIAQIAEETAEKYNPDGISPFPFSKIEKDKKIKIVYLENLPETTSGGIGEFENEGASEKSTIIFINKNKPRTRQYFTTAHEIGHFFLHQNLIKSHEIIIDGDDNLDGNTVLYRIDDVPSTELETEANNFAASLIMPAELSRKTWETFQSVEECAKLFNVSVIAMSIRLQRLGLLE